MARRYDDRGDQRSAKHRRRGVQEVYEGMPRRIAIDAGDAAPEAVRAKAEQLAKPMKTKGDGR